MPPKKVLKKITIDEKKEIIEKHERGVRVSDLSAQYKMVKSTFSTIIKNKEAIKAANVSKGVTCLSKQRSIYDFYFGLERINGISIHSYGKNRFTGRTNQVTNRI